MFDRMIALLRTFTISRAALFSVLTQGWAALAGLITILIIMRWLSTTEQGFYYTFSSLLALQVFVELGLATVIVQVTSHEWVFLTIEPNGYLSGNLQSLSRLASLFSFSLRWYSISSFLMVIGMSVGGFIFFSMKPNVEIEWQWPWFILCGTTGMIVILSPILSILEGCNQITSVYTFRFVQGISHSFAMIISMILGMGLYSLSIAVLVRLLCGIIFIVWKYPRFIYQILTTEITSEISWIHEIWPFQWRVGVSWISGYFIFSLFTPIMFYYHGVTVAGQMGMTWAMLNAVESISYAWINTQLPQFGMFIAKKQYTELDRLFYQLFLITVFISCVAASCIWCLIYYFYYVQNSLSERVLSILPVTLFLIQRILTVLMNTLTLYLRAHKQEPMMVPSLIGACLTGFSTWFLGATYGPTGAAIGFLLLTLFLGVPVWYLIFQRCRKSWHNTIDHLLVPTDHYTIT